MPARGLMLDQATLCVLHLVLDVVREVEMDGCLVRETGFFCKGAKATRANPVTCCLYQATFRSLMFVPSRVTQPEVGS